jgi:hypothetical protein
MGERRSQETAARPGRRAPCAAAVLTALALSSAAASAQGPATCPHLAIEQTWLAVLAQEGRALSPAQLRALESSGAIRGYPGALWPPSGPAPLAVGLVWIVRPEAPQAIEVDLDGDGTPDIVDTRDEVFGHTYREPGQYAATITVRDQQGQVRRYRSPVAVLAPAAFDAEVQVRWAALKAVLARGDIEAALECVHLFSRQRLEHRLRSARQAGVEAALPPIRFVELKLATALYESVRPPAGRDEPLEVRFLPDSDGVWRLGDLRFKGEQP